MSNTMLCADTKPMCDSCTKRTSWIAESRPALTTISSLKIYGDELDSIPMIRLNRHVKGESTLLKWFKQANGNVLDKMSVLGLIKTEEVAVA